MDLQTMYFFTINVFHVVAVHRSFVCFLINMVKCAAVLYK